MPAITAFCHSISSDWRNENHEGGGALKSGKLIVDIVILFFAHIGTGGIGCNGHTLFLHISAILKGMGPWMRFLTQQAMRKIPRFSSLLHKIQACLRL